MTRFRILTFVAAGALMALRGAALSAQTPPPLPAHPAAVTTPAKPSDAHRTTEQRRGVIFVERASGYTYLHAYGDPEPQTGGYVQDALPAPRPDVQGPPPGPAMAWVPGYYRWIGSYYQYVEGHWVPLPGGFHGWVPGSWTENDLGHYWIPGHWR